MLLCVIPAVLVKVAEVVSRLVKVVVMALIPYVLLPATVLLILYVRIVMVVALAQMPV